MTKHQITEIAVGSVAEYEDGIVKVRGPNQDGSYWTLFVSEAIRWLEEDRSRGFFVNVNGRQVDVVIATSANGRRYLRTAPDGYTGNNLLNLKRFGV